MFGDHHGKTYRPQTFGEIRKKNRIPITLAQLSGDVRRSDVTTTAFANIDSGNTSCQIAGWKGANEIADGGRDNEREHRFDRLSVSA